MKRLEHLLVPMIMAGILVLSGCASGDSASSIDGRIRNPGFGIGLPTVLAPTSVPTSASTSVPTPGSSFQLGEKIPADKAIVYVYHSGGSNHFFILQANGKDVAGLKKKGLYYAYVTEPGTIEFTAKTMGTCSITLDTKAGQAYYLKGSVPPGFAPTPSLVLVSSEVGANEIANCKLTTTILGSTSGPISTSTPAKTAPATSASAPTLDSSFQLGEKIPVDKAVVYIYRPSGSTGGKAMPFGIRVSDKVVTTQVQGGYYAYLTEPGNIEFTVFEIGLMAPKSTSSITVDAKAGLAYYLKGSHGKGAGGRAHLELVSPEVGANEIVNCKVITRQ